MKVLIKWSSGRESTILRLEDDSQFVQEIKEGKSFGSVQRFSLNGNYPISIVNLKYAEEITLLED